MRWQVQGWQGHILAAVAGVLITLSLAPFGLWPLGIASTALLAALIKELPPRQAAVRGWFYGFGLMGSGASWVYVSIHVYGNASIPLAAFLTLLYTAGIGLTHALFCYLYARWIRDRFQGQTLGFAALFVLCEWFRSWFLTGFPWLYLGYAHVETPLAGWVPVGGVLLVTFIVAYSGAVITRCLQQRRWRPAIALPALWVAGPLLSLIDWVEPKQQEAIKVAMVQANIPQEIKWSRDNYLPTIKLYKTMSESLWPDADIVIWPEAAIPTYYQNAKTFLTEMGDIASSHNATLITGIPYRNFEDGEKRSYNSIMAFGEGEGLYHKQRLVPFGEMVPFDKQLRGIIEFFDLPMSNFSAGDRQQKALQAGDIKIAPFICYEIVYPQLVSSWFPDSDLLVTISNDAWFGKSMGPLQHLQMAQMRALEVGRYLVRATGNGVSAIVNERGKINRRSEQFKRETLIGEVILMQGATPFALIGNWAALALSFGCCLLSLMGNRPSR